MGRYVARGWHYAGSVAATRLAPMDLIPFQARRNNACSN